MKVGRKQITWGVVAVVVVLLVFLAMRPTPVEVDTAEVTRGTLVTTVDGEAITRVRDRFAVSAPVNGRLRRILLQPGDSVAAGDIIAQIDPLPVDPQAEAGLRARLAAAQALATEAASRTAQARDLLEQAEREVARMRAMLTAGAISQQQVEQAEIAARSSRADLEGAQLRQTAAEADVTQVRALLGGAAGNSGETLVVRAPVRAVVLRVMDRSARVVAAGTPLLELGSTGMLEIVIDVLSTDAVRITPGARVTLDGWGGDSTITAVVRSIEPAATTRLSALGVDEQRVNVVADLSAPVSALGDGFRLDAAIEIWRGENVMTIPASALFRSGDEWSVFVVEDGKAVLRTVQIDHRSDAAVEVTGGLAEGDEVIVFPSDKVVTGVKVTAR